MTPWPRIGLKNILPDFTIDMFQVYPKPSFPIKKSYIFTMKGNFMIEIQKNDFGWLGKFGRTSVKSSIFFKIEKNHFQSEPFIFYKMKDFLSWNWYLGCNCYVQIERADI